MVLYNLLQVIFGVVPKNAGIGLGYETVTCTVDCTHQWKRV